MSGALLGWDNFIHTPERPAEGDIGVITHVVVPPLIPAIQIIPLKEV